MVVSTGLPLSMRLAWTPLLVPRPMNVLPVFTWLATAMLRARFGRTEDVPTDTISVLAPLLPDPAPPGVLEYLMPGIEIWEARHQARIKYETSAVENMKAKILINIRQG